jgi:hypothetical protein
MDHAIDAQESVVAGSQTWIERVVGTFLFPKQTFRLIRSESTQRTTGLLGALGIMAIVFSLDGIRLSQDKSVESVCWAVSFSLVLGFLYWLSLVGILAIAVSCFGHQRQDLRAAIVTLAWSFAPWMLAGPLFCYEHLVSSFYILLGAVPYIWVLALQYLALMESFQMKWWQASLLVFAVPSLLAVLQIVQIVQSFWSSISPFSG